MSQEFYHKRNFLDLLCDSVILAQRSFDVSEYDEAQFSLARASIMSSVFMLECAANCCLDCLPHGRRFLEDLDKLPFLSKFEVFLGLMFPGKNLDRGKIEVEEVQELKTARDWLVHPKVKKAEMKQTTAFIRDWDFGKTTKLEIPKDITLWQPLHAKSSLLASTRFLDYFFGDLCSYDSVTTCNILMSSEPVEIPGKIPIHISHIPELIRAKKEWNISLDFMGFKLEK